MTSPFYPGTSIQYAWNSSALGELKRCPRAYYYKYIEHWQSRGQGLHLRFGSLYHAALELYDRQILSGADADDAMDRAVDYLLRNTWDGRDDDQAGAPWDTGDTKKNRETLVRSVVWYLDHYANDPARTLVLADGTPALELPFIVELPFLTPNDEPYIYTGHIDRMVTYGEDVFVTDRKTTGSTIGPYYFDGFSPDNQMSGYIYAGKVVFNQAVSGVMIDAAQIAVGFTTFGRGITTRSEGQLQEWLRDSQAYMEMAVSYAERGFYPMNDKACFLCEFRQVCNKDPAVREHWLKTNFEKNEHNVERILG
jgi:hypothetical protein